MIDVNGAADSVLVFGAGHASSWIHSPVRVIELIFDPQRVWRSAQNGGRQRRHVGRRCIRRCVYRLMSSRHVCLLFGVHRQKKQPAARGCILRDVYVIALYFSRYFLPRFYIKIRRIYWKQGYQSSLTSDSRAPFWCHKLG